MRENGYICKGTTMPTQKAMELGLFEIEIRTIERGVGLPLERKTTKVTGKGQIYFANKFLA
jgi:anti-repressor protein